MSRLIINFFRVVQRLLDITVTIMVSLRNFWHFPKELNYSLIRVSTMHHLEHCRCCIIIRFRFETELHCSCICILNDPVITLVMSWSVVIVNMNWCDVSAKKSFCIYQSTTWLGRNRILVVLWTIIFLSKVKLCKSCLKTCNWFVVWLRITLEFFYLLSHNCESCSGIRLRLSDNFSKY